MVAARLSVGLVGAAVTRAWLVPGALRALGLDHPAAGDRPLAAAVALGATAGSLLVFAVAASLVGAAVRRGPRR